MDLVDAAGDFGSGGTGLQTWSPSSESATGSLQFEHFTVGKSWERRGGPEGAGDSNWAMC